MMTRTSTDVYDHRCPKNCGSQAPGTTTVALEMLGSSSSSSEKYHYFPQRPENVYFLYTASNLNPSDNARFVGITAETMTRGPNAYVV